MPRRSLLLTVVLAGLVCAPASGRAESDAARRLDERVREIHALTDPRALEPWPWIIYRDLSRTDRLKAAVRARRHDFPGDWGLRLEEAKISLGASRGNSEGPARLFGQLIDEIDEARAAAAPGRWPPDGWSVPAIRDAYDESLHLFTQLSLKEAMGRWREDDGSAHEVASRIRAYVEAETRFLNASETPPSDLDRFQAFLNSHQTWGRSLLTTLLWARHAEKRAEDPSTTELLAIGDILVWFAPMDPWSHFWRGLVLQESPFRRGEAGTSFETGVRLARAALESIAAHGVNAASLLSLGNLTPKDLEVLASPEWVFADWKAIDRRLATAQYLDQIGGLAGYRACLMAVEIRYGTPDIPARRGWDNRAARDIVRRMNQVEAVAYDVGGSSEGDTARTALAEVTGPSGRPRVQGAFEDQAAPTITIKFRGEQVARTYSQFSGGAAEKGPSNVGTRAIGPGSIDRRFDAVVEQVERGQKDVDDVRRVEREGPPWWTSVALLALERTHFTTVTTTDPFPRPRSEISISLVLPPGQNMPRALDVALDLLDAAHRPLLTGSWRLHFSPDRSGRLRIDTAETDGPFEVSVNLRELPSDQFALVLDLRTKEIAPGRYAPSIHIAEPSGDVQVGAALAVVEVDLPSAWLQMGDITLKWRLEDGTHVTNPVNLVWKGQVDLVAAVELHNLKLPAEGLPDHQMRYAIFPREIFDRAVAESIHSARGDDPVTPEVEEDPGQPLSEDALHLSRAGHWLSFAAEAGADPAILPIATVDSAGVVRDLPEVLQRQRSIARMATISVSALDAGSYVLLVEARDALSGEITHQTLSFSVVEAGYSIPAPRREFLTAERGR